MKPSYATSQLVKNTNGAETKIGNPAIFSINIEISPDNKYLLTFSYLVPAGGFNSTIYYRYSRKVCKRNSQFRTCAQRI